MTNQTQKKRRTLKIPVALHPHKLGYVLGEDDGGISDFSNDHRKRLSGMGRATKFNDIVFTHDGDVIEFNRHALLYLFNLNLTGVDFRGQDIDFIHFHKCIFSPARIGESRLGWVKFVDCLFYMEGKFNIIDQDPGIPTKGMQELFANKFKILKIKNKEFGHVFLINDAKVLCGCRSFTPAEGIAHWVKGSESGGPEFARAMVDFLYPRLTFE